MTDWFEENTLRSHLLLWLGLILVWSQSIHNGYIALDTQWLVVQNPILQSTSIDVLPQIWFDFSLGTRLTLGAEYLPIRDMTVWIDWILFKDSWGGHHVQSFMWYGIACSLLLSCNRILFGKTWMVWLGTAIFMVHPTHVESVIWLASRKDVVSLAFSFLALWLFLRKTSFYWIGLVVLLAYWAKNTAIVVGPLLVLLSLCHNHEKEAPWSTVQWWLSWLPIAIPLIVGLYITLKVGDSVAMFAEPRGNNSVETLNIAAQTWTKYWEMLIWPTQLSLFYAEPTVTDWTSSDVWIGVSLSTLLTIVGSLLWFYDRKWTLALYTIPLGLLPVSQITPIQNLMADRYLLLPSLGLCWCVILLLKAIHSHSRLGIWIVTIWGLNLSLFTSERIHLFQDDIRLWRDVTEKEPLEIRGWTTLASLYRKQQRIAEANTTIEKATEVHPDSPKIILAKGMTALSSGDKQSAIVHFEQAWQSDNTLREAGNNWVLLLQKEDGMKAVDVAQQLTSIHPLYAKGWDVLGSSCLQTKDWICAENSFARALEIAPYQVSTHANLGTLAYLQENWTQAQQWWLRTLELNPTHNYATRGLKAIQEQNNTP